KGASHITSARGKDTLAYIEIDEGPYLVHPAAEAFDTPERPVNVHVSNIVWVPSDHASSPIEVAYLWGRPHRGTLHGLFVKLPAEAKAALDPREARCVRGDLNVGGMAARFRFRLDTRGEPIRLASSETSVSYRYRGARQSVLAAELEGLAAGEGTSFSSLLRLRTSVFAFASFKIPITPLLAETDVGYHALLQMRFDGGSFGVDRILLFDTAPGSAGVVGADDGSLFFTFDSLPTDHYMTNRAFILNGDDAEVTLTRQGGMRLEDEHRQHGPGGQLSRVLSIEGPVERLVPRLACGGVAALGLTDEAVPLVDQNDARDAEALPAPEESRIYIAVPRPDGSVAAEFLLEPSADLLGLVGATLTDRQSAVLGVNARPSGYRPAFVEGGPPFEAAVVNTGQVTAACP
ncbi:MAG: DUF4437 domain-containing protein, partial [Myxococcota bacterium]